MVKSKKIRDSARGEECTLQIVGACNYDPATTVLAHLPDDSGTGKMGGKSNDVGCAVYACSSCHDVIDGRAGFISLDDCIAFEDCADFYQLRALKRTIKRMIEKGLVVIK